ncbi:MarC family NAAT transporter [Jeongeupia sp. USM3]|uniref:MarC family NAAT transporter n=1 Tax=Jeongeupia sp. USM3 TaxID=1906741 RepID=UPI00089E0371|nr:MarC family NAAT transporter [Jeongeupia sp. USM3]AOY00691.1 stress protection protein MarC [Jeongeupia sp. USM3]
MLLHWQFFFGALISLVTMTNPLSKIPMFISLTQNMSEPRRQRQAVRASWIAFLIMTVCLIAGNVILSVFGISYGALRVAGGIVIGLLGYRMLYHLQDPGMAPKGAGRRDRSDYAFFPLAMPAIAGPGTIAVVIGLSTEIVEKPTLTGKAVTFALTLAAIGISSLVMWMTLRSSTMISERLGRPGQEIMTRLMGFVLICVGIQFIGSGVRTFIAGS